ncbi:unnamed protein product [Brassica rapa subsp. narinosa]
MANSFTLLAYLKAGRCSNTAEVRMQGCVGSKYQFRFRNRLTEGSVYSLSGFDVTRRNPNFRFSDAPSPYGSMMEPLLISYRSPLGPYLLSCSDYYEHTISYLNWQTPAKTDMIGELNAIRSTITDRILGAQCVMLTLMFDSMALAFHSEFESYGKEPKIVLATSVNPKIVGDNLRGHGADQKASSSNVVHAQKIEPLTAAELNQFTVTADSQIIEFLCAA